MSVMAAESARRYSVVIIEAPDGRGTWHTVTAPSLSAALRGVRSGSLWSAAEAGEPREGAGTVTVSAIECLGIAGN